MMMKNLKEVFDSKKGKAVIQTYMPEEFSILAAKEQNYEKFYHTEINIREKLNCPPFCDIIIGVLNGTEEEFVKADANLFFEIFSKYFKAFQPMPAPISKINGDYRWRIIIKEKIDDNKRKQLKRCLDEFLMNHHSKVKLNFDINPNNMN